MATYVLDTHWELRDDTTTFAKTTLAIQTAKTKLRTLDHILIRLLP